MNLGRVIVLDGVDGSGKSTLAKAIMDEAKRRGREVCYVHCTYRKDMNVLHHQTTEMWKALRAADSGQIAVIDRLWASEAIYADVYRGGSKWPLLGRLLDRVLLKYCAVYAMCLPNPEAHRIHFQKLRGQRKEMYENVEPVREMFHAFAHGNVACEQNKTLVDHYMWHDGFLKEWERVIGYDMHRESPHDCAKRVLELADQFYELQDHDWRNPENMVLGHKRFAKYLLVGETVNVKEKYAGLPKWPFFEDGNSSAYLLQAVQKTNLPESLFAYVNAYDVCDEFLLKLYEDGLKPIALGAKAFARLEEAGIPKDRIAALRHPQWERRFNKNGTHSVTMEVKLLNAIEYLKEMK